MSSYDAWLDRVSGPLRRITKRKKVLDPVKPERGFNATLVELECGHTVSARRGGRPNVNQRCAFCLWDNLPQQEKLEEVVE